MEDPCHGPVIGLYSTRRTSRADDPSRKITDRTFRTDDPSPKTTRRIFRTDDPSPKTTRRIFRTDDPSPKTTRRTFRADDPSPKTTRRTFRADDPSPKTTGRAFRTDDPSSKPSSGIYLAGTLFHFWFSVYNNGQEFTRRRERARAAEYEVPMTAPVSLGQEIELAISGYGHEGEGVGRCNDFTVFVPGALKGETVAAEIYEVRKNFARARIIKHLATAPERVAPICPVYQDCGGCQLQHLNYGAQLELKRQQVVDAMERIAGLSGVPIHPVIGMENPRAYRNKAQYPIGQQGGAAVLGFYQKGSHQIVPFTECLIQHPANQRLADALLQLIRKYRLSIYNERTGSGFLRHILIKTGFQSGEVMVVLITNGADFPQGVRMAEELRQQFPEVKSVIQNINRSRGNVILGNESRCLAGAEAISDVLADLRFKISAQSFFQVNPVQTEVLYQKAVEYAGLSGAEKVSGSETVLDAYCGVGSLTLFLARRAKRVYGVEVVAAAIANARENAALNRIENVEFIVGETERVLPRLQKEGIQFDVAVVDPPRSGCEESVLRSFAENNVSRIVYVSCNPATLARDLKILDGLGYRVEEIQPVDMFPQTHHVECVANIERK